MKINGSTKIIALIGDPIVKAKTPEMLNHLLYERGLLGEYVVVGFHVSKENLKRTIDGLKCIENFIGAVITMPFKNSIVSLLNSFEENVGFLQACNVILKRDSNILHGYNFDGLGFVNGLFKQGYVVKNKVCVLVGAGGAASSIAYQLLQEQCQKLVILNRTEEKAQYLRAKLLKLFPNANITLDVVNLTYIDILINATPLGMNTTDLLPLDKTHIRKAKLVAECIVSQEKTKLIEYAEQFAEIHLGKFMLEGQLSQILDLFIKDTL